MATVIDALLVTFGLDPSGIKKGAEEGKSSLEGLKSTALKVFAVIGGAVAVKAMISNFSDGADAAMKLSDALGENMEDIQAMGRAAALEGGSVDGFNGSMKNLNSQLVQMATTGGGRSKKVFDELGISATDAAGKVRPVSDVMLDLSDRFKGLSAQEAAGLGDKIGLDAGTINLLRKGREEIALATKAQKELGVYTKQDALVAAEFNDTMDNMKTAVTMATAPIIQMIVPALTLLADWATKAAVIVRKSFQAINDFVKEHGAVIAVAIGAAATIIAMKYRQAIMQATAAMIRLGIATVIANAPLYLMIAVIALISAAIGILVEDFMVWMDGGESAIGAVLGDFETFSATTKEIIDKFGALFMAVWELISTPTKAFFALIKGLFTGDFGDFFTLIDSFGEKFGNVWDLIKSPAETFFTWLAGKFGWIGEGFEKVKGWAKALGFSGSDDETKDGAAIGAKDAVSPAVAAAGAGAGGKSVTASQSVGEVNIYTGTTDVAGVANSFSQKTGEDFSKFVMASDSGNVQ